MKLLPPPVFEKVPLCGAGSVSVREFRRSAFTYPWHEHPEVELTWIVRGGGLRYVGDSVEPFGPGDFCLLGANLPHSWRSEQGIRGGVRSWVLQFDPARLGHDFCSLPEFARPGELLHRACRGIVFEGLNPEQVFQKIRDAKTSMSRLAQVLEILDFLADAPRSRELSLSAWGKSSRALPSARLPRVMAFIADRADGDISHAEVARVAGLTPAAFSRFFRRAVGKTFQNYLSDLRLGHACRLLLESELSISEIAYASGFSNLSTFNRSFRSKRSMTPREFRRQSFDPLCAFTK